MIKTKTDKPCELTVIIPTFNEVNNVGVIVKKLEDCLVGINFNILFVDDNSEDGTVERIQKLESEKKYVSLLLRIGRRGLAGACIEGFISSRSPLVAVIDSDLQHDETKLVEMFSKFQADKNLDLVVGSRHSGEGTAQGGFSFLRNNASKLAISCSQILLGIKVTDPMSGFFMLRKGSIQPFIERLQPNGFKILADILASSRNQLSVMEIGYEFKKRQADESKMNVAVGLEFLALIFSHLSFGFFTIRFILFCFVGLSGIIIQFLSTLLLLSMFGLPFIQAHILSIVVAMTTNFSLNNLITYKDRSLAGKGYFRGLLSFYIVCSAGALANVATAKLIFESIGIWSIASIGGAFLGAVWNFVFSSIFTWKSR